MRASIVAIAFVFLFGCAKDGNFDGSSDGVVITKNPKGSTGGKSEPKQLQLSAPWLAESSEFVLEVYSVRVLSKSGNSVEVGLLEKGTFLSLKKTVPKVLQFDVDSELLANAASVELVTGQLYLKSNQRITGTFAVNQIFSFTPTDWSLKLFKTSFSQAQEKSAGVYTISKNLCTLGSSFSGTDKCGSSDDYDDKDDDSADDVRDDSRD